MRTFALTVRILHQLRRDRRTLMLMTCAPLLVLTLVYFLLNSSTNELRIAVVNAPQSYVENLYENNLFPFRTDLAKAESHLEKGDVAAIVSVESGKVHVKLDGSESAQAKLVLAGIQAAKNDSNRVRPDLVTEVEYLYGYEDLSAFDNMGAPFIGVLIFFYVFLISGIAFLQERTIGTLEKLLSTPIRRWEIVAGYACGYGVVTILQSVVISWYVVYVLGVMLAGSFLLVLLINLLTAVCALTFGILLSTAANNEFQMIQFVPVVIIPQIFLCGLFALSPTWEVVGHLVPLYYVADALTEVMIRGSGFSEIALDLVVIVGCSILFMIINTLVLKKYRRI